jgi:hypothetical protein
MPWEIVGRHGMDLVWSFPSPLGEGYENARAVHELAVLAPRSRAGAVNLGT